MLINFVQGDIQELRIVNGADQAELYFCESEDVSGSLRNPALSPESDDFPEGSGNPYDDTEDEPLVRISHNSPSQSNNALFEKAF